MPASIATIARRLYLAAALLASMAALLAGGGSPALAAETPQAFVDRLASRAIQVFAASDASKEAKTKQFADLLAEGFDLTSIAKFCLGRFWRSATPAQQGEYLKLFEEMIVNTYAGRFAQYSGETYRIKGSRPEADGDISVSTEIVSPGGGSPIKVDWRVRSQPDGNNRIIDVAVEEISMLITLRSEIASIVQRGGGNIDGLLVVLRARVAQAQIR
ncbi:MAG: ABC transporter substrate-binding protein [Alphaproteobacteria bacterium]|nr:ABC transporter substrate-binding protein [Alphaproteobacteria bacterium]